MIRAGEASAAAAGYKTKPLVVPVFSGYVPEEARSRRGVEAWGRRAREPRVAVPTREVVCYECGKRSHIPVAALSAHCVHCCTHLNTVDVELKPGTRKLTVRTLGDVTLPAEAELSHLSIVCRHMFVSGKASGTLRCSGTLTVRGEARVEGQVRAETLHVSPGARAVFSPGVSVNAAEIEGTMCGRLHAEDAVHIAKTGCLEGDCHGARLMVDPGGVHRGVWVRAAR